MAAKFIVFATILAASNALPVWYNGVPAVVMRIGRSPSISYGFGSGFSSKIGDISHSTGIGASFQSGEGEAYGAGIGSSNGGYAHGVGIASAGNSHPVQYQAPHHHHHVYQAPQPAYESAVASAQNFGGYGNAVSSAQSLGGNNFGSAVSSAQSGGPARFNSAVSSAQNVHGYGSALSSANSGYGSALSSAHNSGFGSSVSSAQTRGHGYGSAVSAAENIGGYGASTAQVAQQRSGGIQHSGATSINAPGLQAAHSHAINSGFF